MILFLGFVIMIMGTFGNLFAAVEHKSMQLPSGELGHSKNLKQIKAPPKIQSSTEIAKKRNSKDVLLPNSVPPEKLVPLKSPEALKPQIKISEKVRKEPPVPVAPLPINDEKPSKGKVHVEVIENKIKGEVVKNLEPEQKKPKGDFPEVSRNENINRDAIEKEERELMEVEQQKKTEEDRKQQELLQRLKEHQDEQKKLLKEQEKILKEMKDRKNEKKSKQEELKDPSFFLEETKTIKPEEFKANLNKIQNVIKNLKDTKNILEKEKLMEKEKAIVNQNANFSSVKTKGAEKQEAEAQGAHGAKEDRTAAEAKNPMVSVPLPLVKLQSQPEAENGKEKEKEKVEIEAAKSKQKVLGRDILVERMSGREKRDVEDSGGNCLNGQNQGKEKSNFSSRENEKTEKLIVESKNLSEEISNRSSILIRNSAHLSLNLADEKKPEMAAVETSKLIFDFQNEPFISKKRDLKSISTTNS